MTDSFHCCGSSSLFQIEVNMCISECNILPPAWISSARIWSLPGDLYHLRFSIVISASKELGTDTNGSAV
jgi:hypothetical protein